MGRKLREGGTPVGGTASPGAGAISPSGARGSCWAVTSTAGSPTTTPSTSFTEGDRADTYTLTVTNTSSSSTDGSTPVKLTDVVGPGLTLVPISCSGWSCDTSNPIVGKPDLTATNSLATAFRQGDASGGGEIDQSNDYFDDPTFITPLQGSTMTDALRFGQRG